MMEIPAREYPFKGNIMGRPIQSQFFNQPVGPNSGFITVNGVKFADGTTATNAYIVQQTGSNAYVVQDSAQLHAPEIVFMVNAASTSTLLPGQCYILATPFSGSTLPCSKIAQFRVDIFTAINTTPSAVGTPGNWDVTSYSWGTQPAVSPDQADLLLYIPVNVLSPVISGSTTHGTALSASTGIWTGTSTIVYSYQWKSNGTNVGTNSATYTTVSGDIGHTITVTVTGTNGSGNSSATSVALGPIV